MQRDDPRARFRELLAGDRCLIPASIFDPVSARIAETIGYEMGLFAGSVASFAVLGAPDVVVMTLSDLAEQARRICRASSLPLLVDADHGFGNALNAMRTVEELETAGVSALMIEDLELPAAFGTKGARLISTEETAGKLRAALEARRDPNLIIIGRTRAVVLAGIDDAVARLRATNAPASTRSSSPASTRARIEAIAASVKLPLLVGYLSAELADPAYLASKGVKVWGLGGSASVSRGGPRRLRRAQSAPRRGQARRASQHRLRRPDEACCCANPTTIAGRPTTSAVPAQPNFPEVASSRLQTVGPNSFFQRA